MSIDVIFPAKNEQATIGTALWPIITMRETGLIDRVIVMDQSNDWTGEIAASQGAQVYRTEEVRSEYGPVIGKGDAMWRSLIASSSDVILWLDADSTNIQRHYVLAMVAPILEGEADFVKGHYRRPLGGDPDGGGRLNHLFAKPLLRAWFPELAWIEQPLAGETAITRELAWKLPFEPGWAIEPALTIDAYLAGARIAQADLGVHEHRHWPIRQLAERCDEVLATVIERADGKRPQKPWSPEVRPAHDNQLRAVH
jgi:glucosyl-3-phosphoglycerate synthase